MGLLEPKYDAYPALVPTGSGGASTSIVQGGSNDGLPGASDNPANWTDSLIGPTYELYPLSPATISVPPPTAGGTSSPSGSSRAPTSAHAPSAPSSAVAMQRQIANAAPAMPFVPQLQRAYCFNPVFHGERGEKNEKSERKGPEEHITREAEPVSFTVPPGCNAADLWFGPIEPAPGARPQDFQHVIQTGKARVLDGDGGGELDETNLQSGQHLAVVVPWRAAASTKLEPGRLRMAVMAHFYAVNPPPTTPQNQ
jgi:hypothetical protein